jgi:hypothetical protein
VDFNICRSIKFTLLKNEVNWCVEKFVWLYINYFTALQNLKGSGWRSLVPCKICFRINEFLRPEFLTADRELKRNDALKDGDEQSLPDSRDELIRENGKPV